MGKHLTHKPIDLVICSAFYFPKFRFGLDVRSWDQLVATVVQNGFGAFRSRFEMELQADDMLPHLERLIFAYRTFCQADCPGGKIESFAVPVENRAFFGETKG